MKSSYSEALDNSKLESYKFIERCLRLAKEKYKINIYLKDIEGMRNTCPELKLIFDEYGYLDSDVCKRGVERIICSDMCNMNCKWLLMKCWRVKRPLYNSCVMGVEQLVYPVIIGEKVVSIVYVHRNNGERYEDIKESKLDDKGKNEEQYNLIDVFLKLKDKLEHVTEELGCFIFILSEYMQLRISTCTSDCEFITR